MNPIIINNVNGIPIIATGEFPFVPMNPNIDNNSQVRVMKDDSELNSVMYIDPAHVTE
jgi:hypothetical protein